MRIASVCLGPESRNRLRSPETFHALPNPQLKLRRQLDRLNLAPGDLQASSGTACSVGVGSDTWDDAQEDAESGTPP